MGFRLTAGQLWVAASLPIFGLLLNAACARAEANWTEFRGPNGQGHSQARDLPLRWSPTENVRWSVDLPGAGWSSPVVVGDTIYVTAAMSDADDSQLKLMLLDGSTGATRRDVALFRQTTDAPKIHPKNSHASPTPVIAGGRVYVHFGHQGTACVDLNGDIVWRNDQIKYEPQHGNGGSPVLVDDLLVFSCDGRADPFIIALDKQNGQTRWRRPRDTDAAKTFSFCTPLAVEVNGQVQVISPGSNQVAAFDPVTGREIWRVRYNGYSVVPRPIFGHGLVFISTGFDSPIMMAIRPDGTGDVTDTHVVWSEKRGAPNTPSMLLVGDHLYTVSDRGVAGCLDARTGQAEWQKRLGGNFSASPLYADGHIYFQSEEGEAIVVAADPEFREVARNDLQQRTLASYAVIDNDLLIRTESSLFRIAGRR